MRNIKFKKVQKFLKLEKSLFSWPNNDLNNNTYNKKKGYMN